MAKMRCFVIGILVLLLLPIVYSASFEVKTFPIVDEIIVNEEAKYKIEIKNNLDESQEFRIYTLNYPFWDIRTEPLINPITLEVEGRATGSIELDIIPLHTTNTGTYAVNVNVQSLNNQDIITIPLKVSIKSTEPLIGGFVPTIITSVSIPRKIDPRDEIPIKINLNNQNSLDYKNLTIFLKSNLITETLYYALGPKDEKLIFLTKKIDPLTEPQDDSLMVTVYIGDRIVVSPIVKPFEVVEYSTLEQISSARRLFVNKKVFLFVSNNKNFEGKAPVETSFSKALFSSTNPKAAIVKENNKKFFVWDIKLDDENSVRLKVSENYLPLVIIIGLLILFIFLYYSLRSPLILVKEAKSIKVREGGISELKVVLHLKNRSSSPILDINITERSPHMVQVEKELSIGTLQPEKILRHDKNDTIIKWKMDKLEPHEERVLTYKISSRLPIIGSLSLPAAGVRFSYRNKWLSTISNRLTAGL